MDRSAQAGPSAVGSALLTVGDQWTLLILQRAFLQHARRFSQWRDALGISESVLTKRLAEMVSAGLLQPATYRTPGRDRREYLLTPKAIELWSFLVATYSWERRWVELPPGSPLLYHAACGRHVSAELGCGQCAKHPVTARDTSTTTGESETFAHVAVARHHRRTVRAPGAADPVSFFPQTMEILGDRWSTIMLAAALLRVRRFADFQQQLGIAPSVLSERLSRFVEVDVLRQRPDDIGRDEYRLTGKGLDFFPIYAFLIEWAHRWYRDPVGHGMTVTHDACRQPLLPRLYCTACGQELIRTAVRFDIPGAQASAGSPVS